MASCEYWFSDNDDFIFKGGPLGTTKNGFVFWASSFSSFSSSWLLSDSLSSIFSTSFSWIDSTVSKVL